MHGMHETEREQDERTDTRQSQIEREMLEQAELLQEILLQLPDLETRLNGVLRQDEDAEKVALSEPHAPLVYFAETLHGNNGQLRSIRGRLSGILSRLEL